MGKNKDSSARRKAWWKNYRRRMDEGLEECRECGDKENLTFGHLIPKALGGTFRRDNLTILCLTCNWSQGTQIYPHLISLAEEERLSEAKESKRWGRCWWCNMPWKRCWKRVGKCCSSCKHYER